ncbi:MAG: acetyl-CoA carboxylase biotin carboxyl carrier protein [Planctomycetota bacterium]|nr:MAG: acetyl-CoA carboxylase biotin carboxyl carrier protein [Planctomycetota bacterium]
MDLDLLQRLIALMKEGELTELEYEDEESKVRLSRKQDLALAGPAAPPAPAGAVAPAHGQPAAPAAARPETEAGVNLFRAPMVGTFYRAPSPEAEPYVQVGDRVNPESVICILEAMKVMNEIKAEMSGEIVAVLLESGEPVEYGQPLFKIRTA